MPRAEWRRCDLCVFPRPAPVQRWNETYVHFHKTDPKQTYYLSMEYLQGRALTNAVGNLGITGAYAEAVKKFGYELEALAAEVISLRVPRLLIWRVICLVKFILVVF
jgi:glucan phosphorylase